MWRGRVFVNRSIESLSKTPFDVLVIGGGVFGAAGGGGPGAAGAVAPFSASRAPTSCRTRRPSAIRCAPRVRHRVRSSRCAASPLSTPHRAQTLGHRLRIRILRDPQAIPGARVDRFRHRVDGDGRGQRVTGIVGMRDDNVRALDPWDPQPVMHVECRPRRERLLLPRGCGLHAHARGLRIGGLRHVVRVVQPAGDSNASDLTATISVLH